MSESETTNCGYCGNFHHYVCPRIKSIIFNQDGTQKSVEFFAPKDYPPIHIGGSQPQLINPLDALKWGQNT